LLFGYPHPPPPGVSIRTGPEQAREWLDAANAAIELYAGHPASRSVTSPARCGFVCVRDLEDELFRSLDAAVVEQLVDA
jgi:hypothetical protein